MRQVLYTTESERNMLITNAEDRGETMIHDDFDVGPNGEHRLTFDTLPASPSQTERDIILARLQNFDSAIADIGAMRLAIADLTKVIEQ